MRRALAAAGLTVIVAGCGGGSVPHAAPRTLPPTPTRTVSLTPTPTPTPTMLTVAQARAAYLRIVKAPNADLKRGNRAVGRVEPLSFFHDVGRHLRRDMHAEAVALRTILWPANAARVADRMADADATVVADVQDIMRAHTVSAAVDAWDVVATDTSKAGRYGEQMRELLGLPPA